MSSSRRGGDRGKGIAQDQDQSGRRKSKRPTRHEVMDEVSRQTALRLQAEEDHRSAMILSQSVGETYESYHSYGGGDGVNVSSDDNDGGNDAEGGSEQYPPTSAGLVGENEPTEPPPPPQPQAGRGKKKTLKSDIFVKHYKKVPVVVPNPNDPTSQEETNEFIAYCNYCDKCYPFSPGGGYGTLHKHLKTKHPIEYGVARSQSQLNFPPGTSDASGTPLFKYDPKVAQDALVRWAAMKHLPFNFFDDKKFEVTMQTAFNVGAKRIPATSHQRSNNRQFFEKQREVTRFLSTLGHKVNICSDVWTDSFKRNSYMGITCHFVDNSWTLHKRLIGFRQFPTPHTAPAIAALIIQVLNEYKLCNKIFSVGFDNATANTASIGELIAACAPVINGRYFHQRCICHILNLCVQDALSLWQKHVDPIRTAVNLIHWKPHIGKAWKKYCHQKKIRYTNFSLDVSTRWNSTYDCLNSTLEHIDYLIDFFRTYPVPDLYLSQSCWDQSMSLFKLFQNFKNATVELSGVYYCTSVRVLEHCMYISLGFKTAMKKSVGNPELMCVLYYMIDKWLKYFSEIPPVFLIAKVLDPKWKLAGTLKILEFYYNNLRSIDLQPLRDLQSDTNENYNVRLTEVFEINLPNLSVINHAFEFELRTLFAEYEARYNSTHQVRQRPAPQQRSFGFFQMDDPDAQSQLADLYGYTTGGSRSGRTVSELDLYFDSRFSFNEDEGPTPNQIDVLDWWGTHEKDFPILASMAKEIFSIPASTVAVESAFSVGGNVLDDRRSRLSGQNMEATMLLDDWCSADIRDQELDWNTQVQTDQDYYPDEEEFQQQQQ